MSEENERDAGFCSGEDLEDPLEPEDDLHSPTDVSEDSVEVKVLPISLRNIKNKRKCAEPRKVANEDDDVLPPYKKRRHFVTEETNTKRPSPILQVSVPPRPSSVTSLPGANNPRSSPVSPFRPWSQHSVPAPTSPPQHEADLQTQTLITRCPSTTVNSPAPPLSPSYSHMRSSHVSPPPQTYTPTRLSHLSPSSPSHTPTCMSHLSPPPQSYTPTRYPQASNPRRCNSASVTASSSTSTPELTQQFNDRVPSLHQQEEPLSLVLKNGSNDLQKTPQRREKRPCGSPISSPEARIYNSEFAQANRLKLETTARLEDMRLYGAAGPMIRTLSPAERYGFSHARMMQDRHCMVRPVPSETIVRCPTIVNRTQPRFEAVDYTQSSSASVGMRTLSECEDRGEVEDLSSGTKLRTSSGKFSVESLLSGGREAKVRDELKPGPSSIVSTSSNPNGEHQKNKISPTGGQQRNYKNMTRERRIEANARERTRVHTISAAFDTLRRAIPAYSHNQKLSKLSVLRIACSYILTLSRVAGQDYSVDSSEPSLADCVDLVSRTIQTEGKLRRKKDD